MVVFEDEVRSASSETYIMNDDGGYGEHGLVTKSSTTCSPPAAKSTLCSPSAPSP